MKDLAPAHPRKLSQGLSEAETLVAVKTLARFHGSLPGRMKAVSDIPCSQKDLFCSFLIDIFRAGCRTAKTNFACKFLDYVLEELSVDILLQMYDTAVLSSNVSVCHGDLWMSNILFPPTSSTECTTTPHCYFIDWQFMRVFAGVTDLAFLLLTSVSHDLRKSRTANFLQLYHTTLLETNPELGWSYSLKDCTREYETIGLSFALVQLVASIGAFDPKQHEVVMRISSALRDGVRAFNLILPDLTSSSF